MTEFLSKNPWIIIIALMWCVVGFVIESIIAEKFTYDYLIFTPTDFYGDTAMNWFGSWICFILLFIINPIGLIIKLLLYLVICLWYLVEFIKILFTIGKKDH